MKTKHLLAIRTFTCRLTLVVFGLFFTASYQTFAQTPVGPNNAGTGTNVPISNNADWSNPGYITTDGSPYATVNNLGAGANSDYLQATGYGFSIPSDAIITGIQVTINRFGALSIGIGCRDNAVYLVKNNVIQTTANNKATTTTWPSSFGTATYGSSSDLWNLSWSPSEINNANFGVALSVHSNRIISTMTPNVDYMQITVTYTCPTPSITTQPAASQTVCVGSSATFSVTASGVGLTYQWRKGTNNIGSATSASYTINPVASGDAATNYNVVITNNCGSSVISNNASLTVSAPIASVTSQTNVLCNGQNTGSVTVAGSGGISPYTYALGAGAYGSSGTFSSLAAATYTIHVKDAIGCISDQLVTITQPATAVGGSITLQTNVLCNGQNTGSVTVAGSGGVSPYTYALDAGAYGSSGTFSSLAASSYTVHVKDANGCIFNQLVTITEPAAVSSSVAGKTDISCYDATDGKIIIQGLGGTGTYQFSVDNGATYTPGSNPYTFNGLIANVPYKIRVKDSNGCPSPAIP
jgi:hypothetical protein